MEYNSKSLTREGATMLALADKEEKALIIDEVIVSEKVITAGTDISALTMADFANPLTYGISSKVQSDNQFSVKSVITNHWQDSANTDHTTNKDFNVALVGVVAHVDSFADQHVLTVAVGNDPFVLPAYQGTDVSFVFGITQAYSASQNVTIKMDGSAYALATDLDDIKNLQGSIGIAIDSKLADYVKTDDVKSLIPATVIDGSKPADFKEAVTLEKGAVDGTGTAIATTKDVSDGDAETLKSAKDYADTKISGKADDSKVVHTADMRKPASDVASIDEVNAKQDKIGYTPADDSKVFHSTVTQLNSTDMNTVLTAGFYKLNSVTNGMPNADDHTIYQVINYYSSNGVQIAYGTNNIILGMRSWYSYRNFTSWVQFADDSKVAHLSGNEEIGGQKTFDTAPVDKTTGNPYITKSDVATAVSAVNANVVDRNPDTGVVSEPVDFTNAKVNGHSIVPIETSTDKDTAQADSATTPNVIYLY